MQLMFPQPGPMVVVFEVGDGGNGGRKPAMGLLRLNLFSAAAPFRPGGVSMSSPAILVDGTGTAVCDADVEADPEEGVSACGYRGEGATVQRRPIAAFPYRLPIMSADGMQGQI